MAKSSSTSVSLPAPASASSLARSSSNDDEEFTGLVGAGGSGRPAVLVFPAGHAVPFVLLLLPKPGPGPRPELLVVGKGTGSVRVMVSKVRGGGEPVGNDVLGKEDADDVVSETVSNGQELVKEEDPEFKFEVVAADTSDDVVS